MEVLVTKDKKNKNKKDEISNKPLNPSVDYEEYVGGETDSRMGVTKDFDRAENEALEEEMPEEEK